MGIPAARLMKGGVYFSYAVPRRAVTYLATEITALVLTFAGVVVAFQPMPAHASVFDNVTRWPIGADGYAIIPVCIVDGSSTTQKNGIALHDTNPSLDIVVGQVRDALRTSWEKHSSVRFVGWENCDDLTYERAGAIGLYIHPNAPNRSDVGISTQGKVSADNPSTSFKPWGSGGLPTQCIEFDWNRSQMAYRFSCVEQFAIHEVPRDRVPPRVAATLDARVLLRETRRAGILRLRLAKVRGGAVHGRELVAPGL